jgi:hypothetical protein
MTPRRDDNETTTRAGVDCPVCGRRFTPVRRQAYCTPACKQVAWRRRTAPPPPTVVPARRDRSTTVYECAQCESRYLGRQWCDDCVRPCHRLGPGGECDCGELLTVDELLGPTPAS